MTMLPYKTGRYPMAMTKKDWLDFVKKYGRPPSWKPFRDHEERGEQDLEE